MTSSGEQFEADVRRIARELWPSPMPGNAAIIRERERDGIFETDEAINIIEATILKTKEKAEYDINKTASSPSGVGSCMTMG